MNQTRAVEDMDSANAVSITNELPRHLEPPTAQIKAKEDVLFQDTIPKYMYISKSNSYSILFRSDSVKGVLDDEPDTAQKENMLLSDAQALIGTLIYYLRAQTIEMSTELAPRRSRFVPRLIFSYEVISTLYISYSAYWLFYKMVDAYLRDIDRETNEQTDESDYISFTTQVIYRQKQYFNTAIACVFLAAKVC